MSKHKQNGKDGIWRFQVTGEVSVYESDHEDRHLTEDEAWAIAHENVYYAERTHNKCSHSGGLISLELM